MAELGESGNPTDLVPGNPGAIDENVVAIRGRGRAMLAAADGLAKIDAYAWTGPAAERFHDKFSYEPARWRQAGDAFEAAASALAGYAETLRWAQGQAAEAIRLWDAAEQATRVARTEHERNTQATEQANQQNAANGHPPMPMPVFFDPGEAQRQAAREVLNRARQQLTEAGDRTAAALRSGGDSAPEQSFWDGVGEFFGDLGDGIVEFGKGLWDAGVGTVQAVGDLITDPAGTIAQSVVGIVTHPVDFLKGLVAWDTWAESPGRALGQIVGGVVLGGAVGKLLKGAGKGNKDSDSDSGTDTDSDSPARTEEEKQQRYQELGTDPSGQFRPGEAETARLLEENHGIQLDRSPDPKVDWVDKAGKTYDAVGPFDGKHLQYQWDNFTRQIEKHLEKADFVPVNVSQFTPEQIARVREFIAPLGSRVFIIGG